MTVYCYRCPDCGAALTGTDRELNVGAIHCETPIKRDYRAEGVGIGGGVRVSRDGTLRDQAELFLPTNKELAGPGDPDGTKGMRTWREEHSPKDAKKHVWPGEVERTTF